MTEENVIVWEAPPIVKPEFRLYYDEKGHVEFYTCEKLEGNYVVIDAQTFAEARPDVRVIDGRVVRANMVSVIAKLEKSTDGILCEYEDLSVITKANGQRWNLKVTEYSKKE